MSEQQRKKYPRTSALNRRIDYYPRPSYEALVKAYADDKGISRSAVVDMGVKLFFDTLNTGEKQRILRQAKNQF